MKLLSVINVLFAMLAIASLTLLQEAEAYHKQGHVKIKVWRGPSHGYKKHKYAPFGYHFSIEEKGH